jgi:phosphatidylserine decarboxylase
MIAREGWAPLSTVLGVAVFLVLRGEAPWSVPAWLLLLYLVVLYHYPDRQIPPSPLAVVCPADGRVVEVGQARDPWLERSVVRLAVALAAPGVTALRSPTEGKVMDLWVNAEGKEASKRFASSGRYTLWLRTDEGDDVVFSVLSRGRVSRFKADVGPGERVGQGTRIGFVYFGAGVEILVPANSRPAVSGGEAVLAGSGVLATLVHS